MKIDAMTTEGRTRQQGYKNGLQDAATVIRAFAERRVSRKTILGRRSKVVEALIAVAEEIEAQI